MDDRHIPKSNGLLSHVFSFVSREFESFVLNATSRPENKPASTGRAKGSGRRRGRDSEGNMSDDEARYRSRNHRGRGRLKLNKPDLPRRKPPSKSTDPRKCRHNHVQQPVYVDDDRVLSASDRERSKSPTPRPSSVFPVPPPPKLKKQPSLTMPGSLFPRSPSILPDLDPYARAATNLPILIQPAHDTHDSEDEAGPSWTRVSSIPSADTVDPTHSLNEYASPWRTRSVASVKDAIHRFNVTEGAEADFSLMLPSPHSSPGKTISKAHLVDETSLPCPVWDPVHAPTTSKKGKERARDGENNDDDLEFIVGGTTGKEGVHAIERELDAAREEQREHERRLSGDQSRRASDERERDKRRIRALEEEVRWLKEELSRSRAPSPPPAPPPPPPPPPPLPLRIDTTPCTPTTMFVTARASLRHAMTPVEAPINNPGRNRVKRQGQPTVNVPSEKMAAFLQEIKTAKLRKVGLGMNTMGGDGIAGPSRLSKSVSVTTSSASTGAAKLSAQELKRRRSLAGLRVPIGSSLAAPVPVAMLAAAKKADGWVGQKRKADALGVDETTSVPPKRRMAQSSFQSSSSHQHTAASSLKTSSRSTLSVPLPTNETDLTTPSLCSDNDRDENSVEDPVPSTPPGPRSTAVAQKAFKTHPPEEQIEVIDVDMEERSHPEPRSISPTAVPRRTSDPFKKRPPMSPIPIPTPRRPSAPARTKRGAIPRPKSTLVESDEDDEDGLLSQSVPVPFLSLIPVAKHKSTKSKPKPKPTLAGKGRPRASLQQPNGRSPSSGSGSSSQNKRRMAPKRRQTLDEEIRTVEARSSDVDECNDELEPEEKEEDVFVATGTKSARRGFLAHGGAGGVPVYMGVGYVDGVVESEDEDEGGPAVAGIGKQPRRLSKSAGQASLIPRPRART